MHVELVKSMLARTEALAEQHGTGDCGPYADYRDNFVRYKLADNCIEFMRAYVESHALRTQLTAAEARERELVEALDALVAASPQTLDCLAFHHAKRDQHEYGEDCKPQQRYMEALANAALAACGQEG